MQLAAMQFRDYVWPHNPRVYTITYEREIGLHKVPFGRYQLQDLGLNRRVMKGEGAFVGEDAYDEFKKLATVFYEDGAGILVHPVWQTASAYFVDLSLTQEPKVDYVAYTFTFWEDYTGQSDGLVESESATTTNTTGESQSVSSSAVYHTVSSGESLWVIANQYGVSLADLIEMNPEIKNPNLIYAGQKVRVS